MKITVLAEEEAIERANEENDLEQQEHTEEDDEASTTGIVPYEEEEDVPPPSPFVPGASDQQRPGAVVNIESLLNAEEYEKLITTLNDRQRMYITHVIHELLDHPKNQMLHVILGPAGTGKSLLIKALTQITRRIFGRLPNADPEDPFVVLAAPTGKAAHNIGGVTLHAAFNIPTNVTNMRELQGSALGDLTERFDKCQMLIIDEISLLGASMFQAVHARLNEAKHVEHEAFGGVHVILFGDFNQLSPVGDSYCFIRPKTTSSNPVVSRLLAQGKSDLWKQFRMFVLTEVMRQQGDHEFANALIALANGNMSSEQVQLFKKRQVSPKNLQKLLNCMHLFARNKEANEHNIHALTQLDSPSDLIMVEAIDIEIHRGHRRMSEKAFQTAMEANALQRLPVRIGGRYMLTRNLDVSDGLFNGATGTLRAIHRNTSTDRIVELHIEFDDSKCGRKRRQRMRTEFTAIKRQEFTLEVDKEKMGSRVRKQFPLVVAHAMTVHKAQGSTLHEGVVVHLDGCSRQHLYVALSRVTSIDNLYLVGVFQNINNDKDRHTPQQLALNEEMKRLQEEALLVPKYELLYQPTIPGTKRLIVFNCQGLQRHRRMIECDPAFKMADILILTETHAAQPLPEDVLSNFLVISQHIGHRLHGVCVLVKNSENKKALTDTIVCTSSENQQGLDFVLVYIPHMKLFVAAVYCSPQHRSKENNLLETMKSLMRKKTTFCQKKKLPTTPAFPLIIAGDLNVNLRERTDFREKLKTLRLSFVIEPEREVSTVNNTFIDVVLTDTETIFTEKKGVYVSASFENPHRPLYADFDLEPQRPSSSRTLLKKRELSPEKPCSSSKSAAESSSAPEQSKSSPSLTNQLPSIKKQAATTASTTTAASTSTSPPASTSSHRQPIVIKRPSDLRKNKEMQTLNPDRWVDSVIINVYLQLIAARSRHDPSLPHVAFLASFFWTNVTDKSMRRDGVDYVDQYLRGNKISDYDLIFIPIHLHRNHFALICIDYAQRTFTCYDSFARNDSMLESAQKVLDYFQKIHFPRHPTVYHPNDKWRAVVANESVPQQRNAVDCGVFVMEFAERLSRRASMDFTQRDMPAIRQRIKHVIFRLTQLTDNEIAPAHFYTNI